MASFYGSCTAVAREHAPQQPAPRRSWMSYSVVPERPEKLPFVLQSAQASAVQHLFGVGQGERSSTHLPRNGLCK